MRDMTLLDTGLLAGLLLLSLAVSLPPGLLWPRQLPLPRACVWIAGLGRAALGLAGVVVLASAAAAQSAVLGAALSSAACVAAQRYSLTRAMKAARRRVTSSLPSTSIRW